MVLLKAQKTQVVDDFKIHAKDTGSPVVQIALLMDLDMTGLVLRKHVDDIAIGTVGKTDKKGRQHKTAEHAEGRQDCPALLPEYISERNFNDHLISFFSGSSG